MIAVDTNILVYAHRNDMPDSAQAQKVMCELAEGSQPWTIAWHCIHEFYSVVTNRRIFSRPSTPDEALTQIAAWQESPTLRMLSEMDNYGFVFERVVRESHVTGGSVYDARIAALCQMHFVDTIWTADRDFSRFPQLKIVNPLVGRRPTTR